MDHKCFLQFNDWSIGELLFHGCETLTKDVVEHEFAGVKDKEYTPTDITSIYRPSVMYGRSLGAIGKYATHMAVEYEVLIGSGVINGPLAIKQWLPSAISSQQ